MLVLVPVPGIQLEMLGLVCQNIELIIGDSFNLPPGINADAYITRVIGLKSSGVRSSDMASCMYGSQAAMMASE